MTRTKDIAEDTRNSPMEICTWVVTTEENDTDLESTSTKMETELDMEEIGIWESRLDGVQCISQMDPNTQETGPKE